MDMEKTICQELLTLLEQKKYCELHALMHKMQPVDLAEALDEMEDDKLLFVFRLLPKDLAAETFVEMDTQKQEAVIRCFSDNELRAVISELFADDTVAIIEEMPANVVKRIIQNADSALRRSINEILQYPADSAGSIMTTEFVDLKAEMTVDEAFRHIRKTGLDKETVYTCYIIDQNRHLTGVVNIKTLLLAEPDAKMSDLMEENVISVNTSDDKEDVAKKFEKYDFLAMPVVDRENRLVGIVTVDDAIDVMQEETNEDFAKMAAMAPIENTYLGTSVFVHARKRILWLLVLMLSATFTGLLITKYEQAFEALPLLVSFIPMLMDTGGNCGSQSSTMIIRCLATDEIAFKDYFRVLSKEIRISLCVSIVLATVNTLRVLLMYGFSHEKLMLSIVLGITLIVAIFIAKVLGCSLPMLAKKCGLDPAIMAAPLITTIVDACSVLVYFNVATLILHL
ncbi:MAG: magnesium transporter [Clostridiales bacterium]|nr:magnesium transporter [Clostridiales bacterium]MDD7309673.1 magnesium transporter [Eubacteriales bacterium]MDY5346786.1 magnesium transporter [Eubacteriales bacterium]